MRLTKWDFVAVCSLAAGLLAVTVSTARIAAQQRGISPRTQSDNEPPVALVIRSGSDAGEAEQPDPPDEAGESLSGTAPDTGADSAMSDDAPSDPSAVEDTPRMAVRPSMPPQARPTPVPAAEGGQSDNRPDGEAGDLQPIPDPQVTDTEPTGVVSVEPASFNGVTPGLSTMDEVQEAWGPPQEVAREQGLEYHLYSIEPFDHIEVSYRQDKVTAVIVRFNRAFPADLVAQHLELTEIRPVLVSNPRGEILGQAFPERGVMFGFLPSEQAGTASMAVEQIILEAISADPFVLRAETMLQEDPQLAVEDLKQALTLDANHGRAHWLRARALASLDRLDDARQHARQAVLLSSGDPQYRITYAQILSDLGQVDQAIDEAESAIGSSSGRMHLKARALCLLGDLYSQTSPPDYREAIRYHTEAVKLADSLSEDPHPAIRLAAKEVLIDAHLGAAGDITWGDWEQKEAAVTRWLEKAETYAVDFVENEGGSPEYLLRVASRALGSCVGLQGQLDPTPWVRIVAQRGPELIESASDARRPQLRWEVGAALYDAVQTYQLLGEHAKALQYGEQAVAYLDDEDNRHRSASDLYLIGRLYFRLGAIHAIAEGDHEQAVQWFSKGLPVLNKAEQVGLTPQQRARLGETLVSMGVSYWEAGQAEEALEVTQEGIALIEKAINAGILEPATLGVPYSNLATMHRQLGQTKEAESILEKAAARETGTLQR